MDIYHYMSVISHTFKNSDESPLVIGLRKGSFAFEEIEGL